jgi:hypothetical protein
MTALQELPALFPSRAPHGPQRFRNQTLDRASFVNVVFTGLTDFAHESANVRSIELWMLN